PRNEWEFEDLCTWITRRVPGTIVYNYLDNGSGQPVEMDPFVWKGYNAYRLEHPDHEAVDGFLHFLAFVEGWFVPNAYGIEYPAEWSPEYRVELPLPESS